MSLRFFRYGWLLTFPLLAAAQEPVRYTLQFTIAAAHYVEVAAEFPTGGQPSLTLFLPTWSPGSYLIREYARNLVDLHASDPTGQPCAVEKVTKNRWRIGTAGHPRVRVVYRLYARENNVRGNWVEADFAVINGPPTFLGLVDDPSRPAVVQLELPAGWQGTYTPLSPGPAPHTYLAADFDTLMDSPIIAGSPQVDRFEVDGVPHALVTLGGEGAWDNARVARNLQRLTEEQRRFWGSLPYRTPYYFFNLLTGTRSGLEHRQSVVISADRWLGRTRDGIVSWLSLASHEYFHAWNGKRLRPLAYGPFDYERENYSRSLWIVEGITSYYQHVLLARAGFYTVDQYLGAVSGSIAGAEKTPGRQVQSLGAASFDAWIKAYRPDENSVNALFSYYAGGSIAGLLFDAEIQRLSGGKRSLDDVMRAAYARYSKVRGYTDDEFVALASELAGADLQPWWRRVIETPGRFDYQPMLNWYGLEFTPPTPVPTAPTDRNPEPLDPPRGWLGLETANREGRLVVTQVRSDTPAANAGVSVDDEILAIDDYRVRPDELNRRISLYPAGATITLVLARQDKLIRLPVTLAREPVDTWKLRVRADSTPEQKSRREHWLTSPR